MALVGERKALAAAVLALYTLVYVLSAVLPPDETLRPLFSAMAGMYGLAFFSLVAGYFWARWFAIGVGLYGLVGGIVMIWQIGLDYMFLFYGGTHALVSVLLWGNRVAGHFDGRTEWRERFHLDEEATRRLGKAIIRVGITLPMLLAYGLAPRAIASPSLVTLAVLAVAVAGISGLLRLRTWGVVCILAAGTALLGTSAASAAAAPAAATGLVVALALIASAWPFTGPMVRYLRPR